MTSTFTCLFAQNHASLKSLVHVNNSRAVATLNQVEMEEILSGYSVLRWAKDMAMRSSQDAMAGIASEETTAMSRAFLKCNQSILNMSEDVTHYSVTKTANVMRNLVQLPGVIDFLAEGEEGAVCGLMQFVRSYSSFVESRQSFRFTGYIKQEVRIARHVPSYVRSGLLAYVRACVIHTERDQRKRGIAFVCGSGGKWAEGQKDRTEAVCDAKASSPCCSTM